MGDAGAAAACWRSGAVVAGFAFQQLFIGDGYKDFWRARRCSRAPHNHILHAMHEVPDWVGWAPTLAMLAGFALAYLYYIAAPALPASRRAPSGRSTCSCSTSGTSTSSTTGCSCGRRFWLGRLLWKGGDGAIIDGLGPDGIAVARAVDHGARRAGCRPATSITTPSPC